MALVLTTSSNPGAAFWAESGSALGITVIENNGTMAGTYAGLVICLGDASLTANTTVIGDLWVVGTLDGVSFSLTVQGDMHVGVLADFFDNTDPTLPQVLSVAGHLSGDTVRANVLNVQGGTTLDNIDTYIADLRGFTRVDEMNFSGVNSDFPDGGTVNTEDLWVNNLLGDGLNLTSSDPNLRSGAGGSLTVNGELTAGLVQLNGGLRDGAVLSNNALAAPNGGNLTVNGNVTLGRTPYLVGANGGAMECTNGFQPHPPGSGGSILIKGNLLGAGSVYAAGGQQLTGSTGGAGGSISVLGSSSVFFLFATGGSANSVAFGGSGGAGGFVSLQGASFYQLAVAGGNGRLAGGVGGAGGTVSNTYGFLSGEYLTANGGSSTAGGTNGAGGSITATTGMSVFYLTLGDGLGAGGAASGSTTLLIGGNCTIGVWYMSNRAASVVQALPGFVPNPPASLQIRTIGGPKNTLNNAAGVATASIAAAIADSIFIANNTTSTWYRIAGVAI